MKNYNLINNVLGWLVFAFASFLYLSTMEPTGSFWDCGEFIAAAHKLQVGHPPGAPFFMVLARFFILFGGESVTNVPIMVNALSALSSAFCILFIFWTITHLGRRLISKGAKAVELTAAQSMAVFGAGLVGSLAYSFSDSFWFSAAEGEVYALSSFFTAIVFWAMLKWEAVAEEKHADRWIILIAFLMGLSIGVHLLNLLCIPALAFIYYFRKYKPTRNGFIRTAVIGMTILGFIQFGIIAGFINLGAKFELFFVNGLGMPFWSGFIFYVLIVFGGIVFGLIRTQQRGLAIWNTALLCLTFLLIGYSTYAVIVVRSNANPPMDENNPEDVFSLLAYLNREQYGDRPLFKGQHYNARVTGHKEGAMQYVRGEKKYIPTGNKMIPIYESDKQTILPRMYSAQGSHVREYKKWADIKGDGTPTMGQNMKFLFKYQLGHMYWRYFMWNFAGRQNDIQGHGGLLKGNWISGIKLVDSMKLGNRDELPESQKQNKGMNTFYMFPLLLGIIGLVYQWQSDKEGLWVVFLLFFFTGIAIVLYLNFPPLQPRERDYAFAGSFYAYAMWIGLGVFALFDWCQKFLSPKVAAIAMSVLCFFAVPYVMGMDGLDDHNRAKRFTSRDFAENYLQSCAPNAILFTNGDNDTFPLWYAQEVEGVRTDVRVVNLSLLNTDWYISQMKRRAYDSDPVPFSMAEEMYQQGRRDYVPFYSRKIKGAVELKEIIDFIKSDDQQTKVRSQSGEAMDYFPSKNFKITVDKQDIIKKGVVRPEDYNKIVSEINWKLSGNYLMKADLMILDLLAHNNWERPVYFAVTVGSDNYMNLEEYFQLEGLAYRVVPIKTKKNQGLIGQIATDLMYDNMMNKFLWGNMNDPDVYLDMNNQNMAMNFRNNFGRLADQLLRENKRDSAINVLDKCMEEIPDETVPYNIIMLRMAELYYNSAKLGNVTDPNSIPQITDVEKDKYSPERVTQTANNIVNRMAEIYIDDLEYYLSLKGSEHYKSVDKDCRQALAVLQELSRMSRQAGQTEIADAAQKHFKELEARYLAP